VGKAKRAHQTPRIGGHGAPKSGLPDFGIKDVSKSATADFDERAFTHPTSGLHSIEIRFNPASR
jgi:hypothetical protein